MFLEHTGLPLTPGPRLLQPIEQQSSLSYQTKKKVSFSVRPFLVFLHFFNVDPFQVYIEFVTVLSLFQVLASWLLGIQDSNSLTRD